VEQYSVGNIHNADKRDFFKYWKMGWFNNSRYAIYRNWIWSTGVDSGEATDNHSCITWGNGVSNSREVARINSRGKLTTIGDINCSEILKLTIPI
jgi:hypothetical protein